VTAGNGLTALPANGEVVEKGGVGRFKREGGILRLRASLDVDFQATPANEWQSPKPYTLLQSRPFFAMTHLSDWRLSNMVMLLPFNPNGYEEIIIAFLTITNSSAYSMSQAPLLLQSLTLEK
jgi:hypothetical protein